MSTKTTKTEAATTEAPKTEAATTEAPKTEAPKTEAPKTEAPKTEAPKTEAPSNLDKVLELATDTAKAQLPANGRSTAKATLATAVTDKGAKGETAGKTQHNTTDATVSLGQTASETDATHECCCLDKACCCCSKPAKPAKS